MSIYNLEPKTVTYISNYREDLREHFRVALKHYDNEADKLKFIINQMRCYMLNKNGFSRIPEDKLILEKIKFEAAIEYLLFLADYKQNGK